MYLVTDGTTGILTASIIVNRQDELDAAVNEIARITGCDRHHVVVNPLGEPYDWVARVTNSTQQVGDLLKPPPGSWADVARMMAQTAGPDEEGFDWDAWKDQMKDQDMGLI